MVCKCRDGTYGPQCCSRRVGVSPISKSRPRSPLHTTYGSTRAGRALNTAGQTMMNLGVAQFSSAHLAEPPRSNKIWRGMTKSQAKIHAPHELRDGKKYDWRPKGDRPLDGFRDANLLDRDKFPMKGRGGVRTRHWDRMPKDGSIYSQTTEYDRRQYKRGQARSGIVKTVGGAGLRFLGTGLMVVQLGTYANWLRKDFSSQTFQNIFYDAVGGNLWEPLAEGYAEEFRNLNFKLTWGSVT